MGRLVNESAVIISNDRVGPRLHLLVLEAPSIARSILPGQFVHVKIPGYDQHVLRRPFSVYGRDADAGTIDILYQEVGSLTEALPGIKQGAMEVIGPVGNSWNGPRDREGSRQRHALLVGGGVGSAPLFMLAESLVADGVALDVVLGAQTYGALVARQRYESLLGCEPLCATDDGSYGHAGFCTGLVEERLEKGHTSDGEPYDYLAVCGPEPLMKIVADMASASEVYCQVSLEKRMACGIGACLSCVVDTVDGKKRSCVDGPIFDASEVIWR